MRSNSSRGGGFAALSDVLGNALDNLGLMTKAKKYQVFSVWRKVVGDLDRHAKPRYLSGDTLFVATASSAWSQELTFMRQSIIDKLNTVLGGTYVREIRFSENAWDPVEERTLDGSGMFPAMAAGEGALPLAGISDSRLKDSARRFSSTMARRRYYLLRKGYVACGTCGCLYPSKKKECPYCRVKRELLSRERAIAILDKAPYLADEEILALTGASDATFVKRARLEMESRCLNLVRNAALREGRTGLDDSELAQIVGKLASLRAGKRVEELSREELEKAIGKRLALAVKKGRPWRRGSTPVRKM